MGRQTKGSVVVRLMPNELARIEPADATSICGGQSLPALVERAGGAARFAWDEFFYAEHHNPHTQKAYMRAVKRFLAWAEGRGSSCPPITPGMVGQYLVGLGGSPAKRNLHLSALRGFFDRLVTAMSSSSTRRPRSRASRIR